MRQRLGHAAVAPAGARRPERVEHGLLGRVDRGGEERVEVERRRSRRAGAARRAAREETRSEEDLAAAVVGDRAGAGEPEAGAAGDALELGEVERRVGGDDGDAAARRACAAARRRRPSSRPTGTPSTRRSRREPKFASTSTPTVAPLRRRGWPCRCRPSSRSRSSRCRRPPRPRPRRRRGGVRQRAARVGRLDLHDARVVEPAVVALADDRDHHVVDADRAGRRRPPRPPRRRRRGRPPSWRSGRPASRTRPHSRICERAGQLAGAVEHRHARPAPARPTAWPGRPGRSRSRPCARRRARRRLGLVARRRSRGRPARRRRRRSSRAARARARRCAAPSSRAGCGQASIGADPTVGYGVAACRLAMPVVWSDRHTLPRPRRRGLGRACARPATEVPARAERDPRRARGGRRAARSSRRRPQPTSALLDACTTPAWSTTSRSAWADWEAAGLTDDPGQDRVVPYIFPHPGAGRRPPERSPAATAARAPAMFAYDTMTPDRPRHVGGGARGARRRADRRRARARGRAGRVRLLPPARPPRDAHRLRRLLLPEQRRGRRGARLRADGGEPGRGHRRRRPPRQRHPGDLLRATPTVLTGSVHVDPGAGWFPHFLGFADETGTDGRGREPQRAARARHRRRRLARGRGASSPTGRRARRRARSWSRSAWTPRAAIPESPLDVTARRLPRGGPRARRARPADRGGAGGRLRPGRDRAARARGARPASRRERVAERDRSGSARTSTRACSPSRARTSKPPPHWRLEAVAATRAPRSLDRRRRPPQRGLHRGRRDLGRLAARPRGRGAPERLTTGREPRRTGRTPSRASRRTARPWPTPTRATSGSCPPPAARRAGSSRARARCGSTTRGS